MNVSYDFSGTHAVVTGAGQGIGFQIARDFLADGATVYIWDYSDDALKHAAAELADYGDRVFCQKVDITSQEGCNKAANQIKSPVRVLVNNAGITRDRSFGKMDSEDMEAVVQTNLLGAMRVTKALATKFDRDSQQCRVVNISSIVGRDGNFGQTNYAAAKAGLLGFTKSLAKEWGRKGFTVNCVAPGFIDTNMSRKVPEEIRQNIAQQTPVGRFGTPGEIAAVCRFLASDQAAYVNGVSIDVDGGLTL